MMAGIDMSVTIRLSWFYIYVLKIYSYNKFHTIKNLPYILIIKPH